MDDDIANGLDEGVDEGFEDDVVGVLDKGLDASVANDVADLEDVVPVVLKTPSSVLTVTCFLGGRGVVLSLTV